LKSNPLDDAAGQARLLHALLLSGLQAEQAAVRKPAICSLCFDATIGQSVASYRKFTGIREIVRLTAVDQSKKRNFNDRAG
jgi:hypothetical protein